MAALRACIVSSIAGSRRATSLGSPTTARAYTSAWEAILPGFQPAVTLDAFRKSICSIVDLTSAKQLERRGGRIPVGGVLPRLANRRGLLLGDAAGAVSPLDSRRSGSLPATVGTGCQDGEPVPAIGR